MIATQIHTHTQKDKQQVNRNSVRISTYTYERIFTFT